MIYHIYWGTSGNSGLYIDEIYQVLKRHGFSQKVFVNYYYPFDYGEKIFFKRGDIANSKHKGILRKLFQLQEVLFGYIKILIIACKDKPTLVNYSHVGQSYFYIVWFLRLIKKIAGIKLMVTCHDVTPHSERRGEMHNRKKIFDVADYLLVHTDNSIKELRELFGIKISKIVKHPFPIMNLSKLSAINTPIAKDTDFLFIGHLRKDKGIEFLLDAWKDFYKMNKRATLKVCGRKLSDIDFDENDLSKYNIEFKLHYINDEEYYRYVKSARYVILPYIQGTNSGIISTVLSLGTDVITSDIPMFKENPMVLESNIFISNDKQSLLNTLQACWCQNHTDVSNLLNAYRKLFDEEVVAVYKLIATYG